LTETLLSHYKFDITGLNLHPGTEGVFEISLDGELIFSKLQEGRFPEHEEVIRGIDVRRSGRRS
jgi:selenoprotein W-related protein